MGESEGRVSRANVVALLSTLSMYLASLKTGMASRILEQSVGVFMVWSASRIQWSRGVWVRLSAAMHLTGGKRLPSIDLKEPCGFDLLEYEFKFISTSVEHFMASYSSPSGVEFLSEAPHWGVRFQNPASRFLIGGTHILAFSDAVSSTIRPVQGVPVSGKPACLCFGKESSEDVWLGHGDERGWRHGDIK